MKSNDEIRYHLMGKISLRISDLGINQTEAATLTGNPSTRISEICRLKSELGINNLVFILERLGEEIDIEIKTVRKSRGLPELTPAPPI